jgi:thymidylate kinase
MEEGSEPVHTVALIGEDGAGKTTVARQLAKTLPWPSKYLYMGLSVESSNWPLPTTVLARVIKARLLREPKNGQGRLSGEDLQSEGGSDAHGPIWLAARLLNRIAEIWWRHLISLIYQLQGFMVIYDRHFLFETVVDDNGVSSREKWFDHLEHWIVDKTYPRPDLAIILEAPAEVLHHRKEEEDIDYLERRMKMTRKMGRTMPAVIVVDASRPLEEVLADVKQLIVQHHGWT